MKIRSMTATFGKLDRAHLELGPGLTLIHAPNEGGKSTWAAFWRAMLYGIDTRDRDKKGYLADKNRYQPWSGAPMEGEIALEYEGREITIRRGPRGNVPFGSFSAVYTGTQEPVPGLTGTNCGELLTGVGLEVFTRSALLGTGNLALTTAPELERRIAALVSSGEEEVSFSQTLARLKEWKNRRQVNKSVGEIPGLESELAQVREALARLEDVAAQASSLEGERSALKRERDRLARDTEVHRLLAKQMLSDRYVQAEEEHRAACQHLAGLERDLIQRPIPDREDVKRAQGELQFIKVLEGEIKQGSAALEEAQSAAAQAAAAAQDSLFGQLSGDEAVSKAASDRADHQAALDKAASCKKKIWLSLAAGVLASSALFAVGWMRSGTLGPYALAGAGLIVLAAALAVWIGHGAKTAKGRAAEILAWYGAQGPEEIAALAQSYQERQQRAERAAHEVEVIRNAVTERQEKRDSSKAALLDFVHQFAPEVKDMFGCSAALSRALSMDHDLALARERAEERRRRLEDLAAQGAQRMEGAADLPVPKLGPEETARALARTAARLEEVSAQLNQAQGTLQAMGDPAALAARQEELEGALARRRRELEAITLAMDALVQANARLQERFSPELDRLTGQYMARLTGDRYTAVSLSRELEGAVRTDSDVLPRSALYLSRGTADQLYLAVRLAVCRLCLPEKPPILLDDALASFDDRRLALALELLQELAKEQQVLLFTCQEREGALLADAPGVVQIQM